MANHEHCNRCWKRDTHLVEGGNWADWLCEHCLRWYENNLGKRSQSPSFPHHLSRLINGR